MQTNRIALIGSNQTPTYDAAGEMTSDGTGTGSAQYTWNAEGRVATVTPYGGTKVTYIYDGDGRLAAEESGSQTLFWYGAGGKLLGTTGGSVNIETIYFDGRRISKFVMAPAGPWGANFYDNADGSLLLETDIYGNTNCRANYDPFGDPVGSGCQTYEGIQYAGLLTDVAGGNYLATHRQLSDTYYRWLSPDPSGRKAVSLTNPQTWNMYAYAGDNPTTNNDPSGLSWCEEGADGGINLSTCVSDKAYQSLKNPKGYLHVSDDTSISVNGSQATQQDYMFALGVAGETARTEIRKGAEYMAINGALAGAGAAIGAGIDWLTASEGTSTVGGSEALAQAGLKGGGIIDRVFETSAGPVQVYAQVTAEGTTAVVKDLAIYPADSEAALKVGYTEMRQGLRAIQDELRSAGFTEMRVENAYRVGGANPRRFTTFTVRLR